MLVAVSSQLDATIASTNALHTMEIIDVLHSKLCYGLRSNNWTRQR